MVVCKFFLQGNCRFGDDCRNEHPRSQPSQNRFAPLQNSSGGSGRGRAGAFGQNTSRPEEYGITTDDIKLDLTHINRDGNRPEWPLSCYAPGRNAPRQLIEGPLEISPEEMRVQYYLARASGKEGEYVNQESALLQQSQQQAQAILSDLDAAKNYVMEGRNQHPNRLDMEIKPAQNFPWVAKPGVNQQSQGQTGAFGQTSSAPSGFGQASSLGAAKPAFGATSTMGSAPTFGQNSMLGSGNALGKPSPLAGGSGFGAPSKLGGGGGFGQPSALGTNGAFGGAQKPAAFGQTSQPAQSSQPAFGQTGFGSASKPAFGAPAFGQPAQASTAFGGTSQPSGFGSTQTAAPAFGQTSFAAKSNPFGAASQNAQQPSQPSTGGTVFGQQSAIGATANKASPFANAGQQQSNSPFAQPGGTSNQPAASSPFVAAGQTTTANGFGAQSQPAARTGLFGTQSQPPAQTGGFGAQSQPAAQTGGFGGQPSNTGFFGAASRNNNTQQPSAPGQIPSVWNGHRVLQDGALCYYDVPAPTQNNPQGRKKVRIWFPQGPPDPKGALYAEAAPEKYEGQLGETLKALYEFVAKEKAFKDGVMPEIPPKREWVTWDF